MMKTIKPRVLISPLVLPEFRRPFYNLLVERGNLDVSVMFGSASAGKPVFKSQEKKLFSCEEVQNIYRSFLGFDLVYQKNLAPVIRRTKYDVLVMQANFGILSNYWLIPYVKSKGLRTSLWMCGWEKKGISALKIFFKRTVSRSVVSMCHSGIAYSTFGKNRLVELGMNPDVVHIAPNTVETTGLMKELQTRNRSELRIKHSIPPEARVLFFMGKMIKAKKIEQLIRAFANLEVKDCRLILGGDGPEKEALQQLCSLMGISHRVIFPGVIMSEKPDFFSISDIAVMPGIGGLFLNEAMGAGLPVVVGESDGTHLDLIQDNENGFLFNPEDTAGLLDTLNKALSLPESHLKKIGAQAQDFHMHNFSLEKMAEGFEKGVEAALI